MAEKKIGSRTFRTEKMAAVEGTTLMFRLGKAAAPLLDNPELLRGTELQDAAAIASIVKFLSSISPEEATYLIVTFCEKAQVKQEGGTFEPVVYDAHFANDLLEAFQVAAFVIQVNYADFFGDRLAKLFSALKNRQ